MQLIKKNNKHKFSPYKGTIVWEYPTDNPDINGAVVEINGRYPDKGRVVNHKCQELVYVVKGKGRLVCEGKPTLFEKGDILIIDSGEKYYWQGDFTACVSNAPKWTPEQHETLEDE
ncbi:MAG: cupin domain-containing protein [Candidatus Beckwithbacteria bacterium]